VPAVEPRAARLGWQIATIAAIEPRTPTVKSFFFRLPQPFSFTAGQHVDVRLTADDGYQAQRSYSIASPPETSSLIELAIERLGDGEVSPFFHDTAALNDPIELRGPIGGHFVWSVHDGGPVLLIGGGSGVVPLACMVRHRAARSSAVSLALVYSARTQADLIFGAELHSLAAGPAGFTLLPTLTRDASAPPALRKGRIGLDLLREALDALPAAPRTVFVCGANPFVEHVSGLLLGLGVAGASIRTERYGG
jgi:ferredoxin-NADP reductase